MVLAAVLLGIYFVWDIVSDLRACQGALPEFPVHSIWAISRIFPSRPPVPYHAFFKIQPARVYLSR
jgi:hypothetical protein